MHAANPPIACRVVGTPVSYGLETFKNRREITAKILRLLEDPTTRMVTIFGHRGIGKSALAAKVVDLLAGASSDCRGVVNLSTRIDGTLTIERIFFTCAELIEEEKQKEVETLWASRRSHREKLSSLFTLMGEGGYVIVLDNIEDQLTDDGRSQSDDLDGFLDVIFRARISPKVLVTSQVPITLDPALRKLEARVNLRDGLPVDECVELLRELDRDGDAGLLHASRADLEMAARRLHGVPRALELTVGTMVHDQLTLPTLDEVLQDFTSRGDIVDQLAHARYRRLSDEVRITMDVLAVFGTPVTREQIAWVIQPLAPAIDVARALSELAHVHMVSVDRVSKEYGLHPLDADIAYAALPPSGPLSVRVLERRVAGWFENNQPPPPWQSVVDVTNHRNAFEHRLRANDYRECAYILDEIGEFLVWQGSIREVLSMHIAISDRLDDDTALLAHLVGLGLAKAIGGPLEEAIDPLQQAIVLAEDVRDDRQLERALFSLGDVFRELRRLTEAVPILQRAAMIAGRIGNFLHQSHAVMCQSLTLTYLGNVPEALELADDLKELAAETGEPMIAGRAADAYSAAYIGAERWVDAISSAEAAVLAYEDAGVPEALGYARNVQGIGLLGLGHVDEAIELLNQARADGSRVETPRAEGLCLYNLTWAYWISGDLTAAKESAVASAEAFRRSGGADIDASENLVAAVNAMAVGDAQRAVPALVKAVNAARGNTDFVPADWVLTEVDRLRAISSEPSDEP